ncbi:MAG: DNA polymerase III subunit delta' [Pseudomonadota bacterium]
MSTSDQIDSAPHPRDTQRLIGQDAARDTFLSAYATGRLHHGWLLSGPRGVGKATLAWSIARFLLAVPPMDEGGLFGAPEPPATLTIDPDHPVARRMAAGAEPGLKCVTRSINPNTDRLRTEIVVDDIRALAGFFQLSATDGGRRVVIIDAANELNISAANALLKMLEEPPPRTTLLLVCHQPSRLLPTIRSRCRTLRFRSLAPVELNQALAQAVPDMDTHTSALAELSGGSVGAAIRLIRLDGPTLYASILNVVAAAPKDGHSTALKLAESAATRGAEDRRDLLFDLLEVMMARLARTGASGQPPSVEAARGEADILKRLAPSPAAGRHWAECAALCTSRVRHGLGVNLDPAALVLDTLIKARAAVPS